MNSTPPKYNTQQNDFVEDFGGKTSFQRQDIGNERRVPRNRNRCLFCCTPKVLMIISVIYFILGMLHLATQLVAINECHKLYNDLNSMNPSNISYDPNAISTLNVNVMKYFNNYDELWISQANDASVTNTTVQIRIATKDSNGQYTTAVTPTSYDINLLGGSDISFASLWAVKCVVSRVEVFLPIATTNTSPVNINSNGLDVKFQQNSVSYPYPINVKTTSSNVNIGNILATNTSIQTSSGDVKGTISLQNELNIETTSGDIGVKANTSMANGNPKVGLKSTSGNIGLELDVPNVVVRPEVDVFATSGDVNTDINLANGIIDSQITVRTSSGDIGMKLHNTFQGQYQITTTSGDISIKDINVNNKGHNQQGRMGSIDSQGSLRIEATSGDVKVEF